MRLDEESAESFGILLGTMGDTMDGRALIMNGPASRRSGRAQTLRLTGGVGRKRRPRIPIVFRLGKRPPTLQPPSRISARAVSLRGGGVGLRPHRIDPAPEVAERTALGLGESRPGPADRGVRPGPGRPAIGRAASRPRLAAGRFPTAGRRRTRRGRPPARPRPAPASAPGSGRRASLRVGRSRHRPTPRLVRPGSGSPWSGRPPAPARRRTRRSTGGPPPRRSAGRRRSGRIPRSLPRRRGGRIPPRRRAAAAPARSGAPLATPASTG